MSLENLRKIGQLKEHPRDPDEIERLLAAAARGLGDAHTTAISTETRFDAAYRAIMQVALAALMSHGYRPDTKRPGHHATVIQVLPITLGIEADRVVVLDTLRRKRNLADYTGDDIDDASVIACIDEATRLLKEARSTLGSTR
ncbi:MAG TPA: DNA-binding protein [Casimicrobiaceae bacterium]|nr:DNA-binding protein [Casimicrobiaceae bacterium]